MFAKLFRFWRREPEPPPDQMSLAVAALLLVEASAREAGIDLRPSTRKPIPDNSKDLGADREPRTNAIFN
jgi:hypothetical protein